MTVIRTDQWLRDTYDDPITLCKKLSSYFNDIPASEIFHHLTSHGMYRQPEKNGPVLINNLRAKNVWEIIKQEETKLRTYWSGPNVPIFILPSEMNNVRLQRDYNGKSGLAFSDKLFLFISEQNTEEEMKALFTHEYNHVCRLAKYTKDEQDYVLLDTIMLEGLAENAVHERCGETYVASWTTYYSDTELRKLWNQLIYPNRKLPKSLRKHYNLLYGLHFYPKMAGYSVGYYLVKKYLQKYHLSSKDILAIPSEKIAQINNEK